MDSVLPHESVSPPSLHHPISPQYLQIEPLGLLLEQLEVHPSAIVHEEHTLAIVPALRDGVGTSE